MDDFEKLTNQKPKQRYPLIIESSDGSDITIEVTPTNKSPDLPADAILTSTSSDMVETFERMKDNISQITEQVKEALSAHQPEEWGVEFNIGFKAKGGIPVIASGEANAALKVTAKWKKTSS